MKTLFFLILFPALAHAGPYYEVVNSTTSGTSTMTISGYIGVAASSTTPTTYKFRIDGPGGYLQFPDGTKQTTAGVASSTISVNTNQFSGNGASSTPLTLISSSVTLQGNTFNGANNLVQMTAATKLPAVDGSLLTNINDTTKILKSGDTMTGPLVVNSSITISGSANGSPYTAPRVLVYGGTGIDTTNFGYLSYGSDTIMRLIYGNDNVTSAAFTIGRTNVFATGIYNPDMTVMGGKVGIGTITPATRLEVSSGTITNNGSGAGMYTSGNSTATYFYGSGAYLTGVGDNLGNHIATTTLNMAGSSVNNISAIYNDGSFSQSSVNNIAVLNSTQTWTGGNTFASSVTINGSIVGDLKIDGAVDIGYSHSPYVCTSTNTCIIPCPTGQYLLSCSASDAGDYICRQNTVNSCICNSASVHHLYAEVTCARIK